MDRKERFLKVYVNLPINLREEVVIVVNEVPISWNVAYLEVKNNTVLGATILEKLDALKVI